MSTDLVKEARGKRKNNVQEKSFINTPVVLQINFPILGYESKGTPWDFAEKAPFYGSLTVSWSPSWRIYGRGPGEPGPPPYF